MIRTTLLLAALTALAAPPEDLLTVAESSGFQATATSAEVLALAERIAARSPDIRLTELGRTSEDRPIPLLIVSDPPVASAAEARASGKAVVFAFGNIHAGEVCGKEALLMLARELAIEGSPLLGDLVVILAPNYNADGNDRMSPDNRPGQVGPARGMGQRPNAQGLDLNRDYVKLESPEARALVRFLTEWDPHLTIDTHTTNGSRHRYTLTFDYPLNPSGHPGPIELVRGELLPEVSRRLEAHTGYATFFYGNFNRARNAWTTYSAQPRYGGGYTAMRGQMSILSEAYAYATYEDRVRCTLEFVREILTYVAEHREKIIDTHERARRETTAAGTSPQPSDVVGLRHRPAAYRRPAVIKGLDDAGEPQDVQVVHLGRFEATLGVPRPHAYLVEPGLETVVEKLRQHGITVRPFAGRARVETYTVHVIDLVSRPFQGHQLVRLEVTAAPETRDFPEGSFIVPAAQPLGTLAVYLLEPQAEDGLAAWNFLDEHIAAGRRYPIARVTHARDLDQDLVSGADP